MDNLETDIAESLQVKEQTKEVIRSTKKVFKEYLHMVNERENADVSVFKLYKLFILKEKTIFTYLNMFKQEGVILQGVVWAPAYFKFEEKMRDMSEELQGLQYEKVPDVISQITKPTLFRSNEFTWTFQEITDTYGIPLYKEVNPAVF